MSSQNSTSKSEKPSPGWTTTPPTEPGFYWLRFDDEEDTVVEVFREFKTAQLRVVNPVGGGPLTFGPQKVGNPDIEAEAEWFGPLTPPE